MVAVQGLEPRTPRI